MTFMYTYRHFDVNFYNDRSYDCFVPSIKVTVTFPFKLNSIKWLEFYQNIFHDDKKKR